MLRTKAEERGSGPAAIVGWGDSLMLSLAEARAQILERAEPGETIEVCLAEALGLVLAEPAVADVDLPPFDRAALDGYALRAADGQVENLLRVVGLDDDDDGPELEISADEAARVVSGDPIPWGADAVLRTESSRPEPDLGPPRLVEVLEPVAAGENLVPRGHYLRAGTVLAPAGARVRLAMVGLLAAQGCVHPVCYRRVRVAVLAVGDHMVGPGEAPVMHRERNAAGATVVAPCLRWGATAHDLGAVAEDQLDGALARALTAPIVVVLGRSTTTLRRSLLRAGVEPVISGLSLYPGKRMNYVVVVGPSGRVEHHVFQLPASPIAALTAASLLVGPLIARLQGGPAGPPPALRAVWNGSHRATDDRVWAVPVTLEVDREARLSATPIDYRGKDDLLGFARAEALALLAPRSGPWQGGEIVEVAPLGPWPPHDT
jgi:molybdopterin molybdotransferase